MFVASNVSPLINLLNEGVNDMLIESENNSEFVPQQLPLILSENGGEDHESKGPKRRADTWVLEEIQCLLNLRRELHWHFNTTMSNKHLWDHISLGMKEKGWERTSSMCIGKWRNLLKEYKKTMNQNGGSGSSREVSYDELEEYCREKKSNGTNKKSRAGSSVQIPDKGTDENDLLFGPNEGGENASTSGGRVISVRWGECIKKIGIDGTAEGIREAIKSSFSLRTKRSFWLEDENGIVRTLDRNMPLGDYTLHLDSGISIRICLYDDPNHMHCHTIVKTFYNEYVFHDYLRRCGWFGLKDSRCCRNIDSIDDLHSGELYHGLRLQEN